jgi:hypothetical protein
VRAGLGGDRVCRRWAGARSAGISGHLRSESAAIFSGIRRGGEHL